MNGERFILILKHPTDGRERCWTGNPREITSNLESAKIFESPEAALKEWDDLGGYWWSGDYGAAWSARVEEVK